MTASIDIRTKAHIGIQFIDEELLVDIKNNSKQFKQDNLELYYYLYKHDSGYVLAIENKTDRTYEFLATITEGNKDYDDINDENNLEKVNTLCSPQKNSFIWLQRTDPYAKGKKIKLVGIKFEEVQ